MLTLTPEEQKWLDDYRRILDEKYGDIVEDIIIYGSKARGDSHEDSDVDVVVLITEGDWKERKQIAYHGYDLSIGTDVVPSILVCNKSQWTEWENSQSYFLESIHDDGISIK